MHNTKHLASPTACCLLPAAQRHGVGSASGPASQHAPGRAGCAAGCFRPSTVHLRGGGEGVAARPAGRARLLCQARCEQLPTVRPSAQGAGRPGLKPCAHRTLGGSSGLAQLLIRLPKLRGLTPSQGGLHLRPRQWGGGRAMQKGSRLGSWRAPGRGSHSRRRYACRAGASTAEACDALHEWGLQAGSLLRRAGAPRACPAERGGAARRSRAAPRAPPCSTPATARPGAGRCSQAAGARCGRLGRGRQVRPGVGGGRAPWGPQDTAPAARAGACTHPRP